MDKTVTEQAVEQDMPKDLGTKVWKVWAAGYDYGAVQSYALKWDCSLVEALEKLYEQIQQEGSGE